MNTTKEKWCFSRDMHTYTHTHTHTYTHTVKGKIITKEEIRRNKILLIFQQLENEFELLYEMHG